MEIQELRKKGFNILVTANNFKLLKYSKNINELLEYKKSYKIRTKIFKPLIKIENALDYSRDHLNQPY